MENNDSSIKLNAQQLPSAACLTKSSKVLLISATIWVLKFVGPVAVL